MKKFHIASLNVEHYGGERKILTGATARKEAYEGGSGAFLQMNLGQYEGKPLSLRVRSQDIGLQNLARLEKKIRNDKANFIEFLGEVKIEKVVLPDGREGSGFRVITDIVDKDNKLNFKTSQGPSIAGLDDEDDEITDSLLTTYGVRTGQQAFKKAEDAGHDINAILKAQAGE